MLGLVRNVRPEVSAHYAVPEWRVTFVKLFLDEVGNVLFGVEPVHCCFRQLHHLNLQDFIHVCILDLDLGSDIMILTVTERQGFLKSIIT